MANFKGAAGGIVISPPAKGRRPNLLLAKTHWVMLLKKYRDLGIKVKSGTVVEETPFTKDTLVAFLEQHLRIPYSDCLLLLKDLLLEEMIVRATIPTQNGKWAEPVFYLREVTTPKAKSAPVKGPSKTHSRSRRWRSYRTGGDVCFRCGHKAPDVRRHLKSETSHTSEECNVMMIKKLLTELTQLLSIVGL